MEQLNDRIGPLEPEFLRDLVRLNFGCIMIMIVVIKFLWFSFYGTEDDGSDF
jgi:hypothetical protein